MKDLMKPRVCKNLAPKRVLCMVCIMINQGQLLKLGDPNLMASLPPRLRQIDPLVLQIFFMMFQSVQEYVDESGVYMQVCAHTPLK